MKNNVSKLDNNNLENNKCISNNSFAIDINLLKAPLFLYNNYKPQKNENGELVKQIEEKRFYWKDSRNMARELYMYCKGRLPRQFESDCIHGLIGLYIKKYAPFPFNYDKKQYEINVSKLEFSWYELCAFMKIPNTGYYIDRLKEAIRILKQTQYFSYENGAFYDKGNNKYVQSGEEGMSLITKYKFKTNKKVAENDEYATDIDSNYVIFDELILNNLRHEYLKYLDIEIFFSQIPSGIGRGIYGFLEANRYDSSGRPQQYIKRRFETLRVGIPVEFEYPYELKNKLKKPLNHMKKIGYIRDFAFGDELQVNGQNELCVYFCFSLTAKEVKAILEKKKFIQSTMFDKQEINDDNVNEAECSYLKMPIKPLTEELIDRKVDREFAHSVVRKKDKWTIIKYILWADKQIALNKGITDIGAVLAFALRREDELELSNEYIDIIRFVEENKLNEEGYVKEKINNLKNQYQEYLRVNVEEYKLTADYSVIKGIMLKDIDKNIDSMIAQNKLFGIDTSKYEEFKLLRENSSYFNELIVNEIKVIKNLMAEHEFIEKQHFSTNESFNAQ